ncbi:MAG: PhzF family phenazine biosynthesis protein [Coprobacillaceae bacterium]
MNNYKYYKIDAFSSNGSLGNPAACLYLKNEQSITENEMLEIAKQHQGFVSEVIYCEQEKTNIKLTYYSSECEVDFCGHGTIACMYHLIKQTPSLLTEDEITILTNKKGKLTVYNKIKEQDAVFITAPTPVYLGTSLSVSKVSSILNIASTKVNTDLPIDIIDSGLQTLIVPIIDLKTEISVSPDESKLKDFCEENNIDIILLFSKEVSNSTNIAHTRVFAPKFGYLEDPATGSGNSTFGYYMLKNKLWDGSECCIEQGKENTIYNVIHLSTIEDKILFGGSANIKISGTYHQ